MHPQHGLFTGIKALVPVASEIPGASYSSASMCTPLDHGNSAESVTAAVADGKFPQVKVGMYSKAVIDVIGLPTDQKSYQTGKACIPLHFGGDNFRTESTEKAKAA